MNTKTIISLLFVTLSISANAQHADGLNGSSYNGLWAMDRQPAAISLGNNKIEVNLFQMFADADNTYLHLKGQGSIGLFNFDNTLQVNTGENDLANRLNRDRSISLSARVLGPSVAFQAGSRNTFAITTGARAVSYSTELDGLTRLLGGGTLTYSPDKTHTLNELRFRTAAMAWGEVGASASHRFDLSTRLRMHAGLTAKYLVGSAGFYAQNDAALLSAVTDSIQMVSGMDLAYGMSDLNAITSTNDINDLMQGSGFGLDGGVVFEWGRKPAIKQDSSRVSCNNYLVRLGLAVTDLGSISFDGGADHRITNGSVTLSELEAMEVEDLGALEDELSDLDPEATQRTDGLRMALPTMVHASLDLNPWKCVFVSMSTSVGLDRGIAGVVNPSNFSITLRMETRHFELGLPVSFHQFRGMRIGAAMRVGPLLIGSDKLGGLMGLTDVGGMDAYVGLKFNIGQR